MQMQPNGLAESQKTEHCVRLGGLLNARDLVTLKTSGLSYLADAPLASCLADGCANLLRRHRFQLVILHSRIEQ